MSRSLRRSMAVALAATCAAGSAYPQELADLDSMVPVLMREHDVPGVALAVVRDGRVVASSGFGVARAADGAPVDAERTVFRVASVAKLFVATVVVDLAARGVLELHADVREYVPDLSISSAYPEPITLHHLLTHTAGLDERWIGYAARSRDSIKPLGEYLAENLPQRGWPPGLVTGYSNHGMALAAYVVEAATGVPYHRYARDSLFAPLGMNRTSYLDVLDSLEAARAVGHYCGDGECVAADEVYSHPYPVGLAYSTAADMARFLIAHLNSGRVDGEQVLEPGAIATMQAEQFTHDDALPGMSYGFFNQRVRGRRGLSHAGNVPGVNNLLLLVPDERLGIYFVANGGRSAFGAALRDSILARLMADGGGGASLGRPVSLGRDDLRRLAGPYQLTRYAHATLEKFPTLFATTARLRLDEEGHLTLPLEGGMRFEPIDSLRFREVGGDRVIAFRRDERGRATHLFAAIPVFGAELPGALERRAWFDAPDFMNEFVSYLVAVPPIILIVLWPLTALVAMWRGKRKGLPRDALRPGGVVALAKGLPRDALRPGGVVALAVAFLFSALFALFGFGFIARSTRMLADARGIVFGMTAEMQALLALPYVLGALFIAMVALSLIAWQRAYWGPARRLYYTVLTVAAALAVVFLVRWNYLPPTW